MVKLVETFLVAGICFVRCVKMGQVTGRKAPSFWVLYHGSVANCVSRMKWKDFALPQQVAPCGAQRGAPLCMQGKHNKEQEDNLQNK